MKFDPEGHVVISPREWQAALKDRVRLTRDIWLVGTPWAFPTYDKYREFLSFLADRLGVHPNNIAVRGSTKVGFSISPRPEKVWMEMRPDSDLDLAIVDPDYYHFFDREIRSYERRLGAAGRYQGREARKALKRSDTRRYYCYRYLDMPDIGCVRDHNGHLGEAPLEQCCGIRQLTAFIYRDWWSLHGRCEADLRDLHRVTEESGFPAGGDRPRSSPLLQAHAELAVGSDAATVTARVCDRCSGPLHTADGQVYFCPRCDAPVDTGSSQMAN